MKYLILFTAFISFSVLVADARGQDRAAWVAKLKIDLLELKGPALLADLEVKKANKIADLDLLINSGKYRGPALERLSRMRENVSNTELPSQDQINLRHERKVKMMKNRLKSKANMSDRKFRDQKRNQIMRDKERWELRKQKNRRTKKD
tara:strand:+ start:175 stop:621 length:447 start_codon:yes stop_codon:yes gene_type:complete